MLNLYTDAALKKSPRAIAKADREDLWRELHDICGCFALFGATKEAMAIWEFACSGMVPMPDRDEGTISVFGDGAISAVCYHLNLPDLSRGKPAPKYVEPTLSLEERVQKMDRWCRPRLTGDVWSTLVDWENPELQPAALYRQARILAKPAPTGSPAPTELDALVLLERVLDMDSANLAPYHRVEALLLAADISVRNGRIADARRFLDRWYEFGLKFLGFNAEEAFALIGVAGLLCDGVLSAKSKLSTTARKRLVETVIGQLQKRLSRPEPKKPTPRKYTIYVSYGQFYLEPLKPNLNFTYFQEKGEPEQGFSAFPGQVAIGTPANAAQCTIEVELKPKMPPLGDAVQAVVVPLSVTDPQGLFVHTVDYHGKKNRFDIPVGDYDVVARFYPHKLKKYQDTCLSSWKVKLTFLRRGTVGANCLRLESGTPPVETVLHDEIAMKADSQGQSKVGR